MWPNAYAPVSTVKPNATLTPSRPIPRLLSGRKLAASTAEPHPPRTSQNVPRNSAASFRESMRDLLVFRPCTSAPRRTVPKAPVRRRDDVPSTSGRPLGDGEAPESGRIEERGCLGDPAPHAHGGEVAD